MTGAVVLDGCRPEPLGSYFKALGVFRLVAEQLDPAVTACWAGDRLVVGTDRTLDEIVDFLVDTYCPTPIVSPWNLGSGFHPKDNRLGISAVEDSTTPRLAPYRQVIAAARGLVAHDDWAASAKEDQVRWCRNELPDAALSWLDTAVVLSADRLVFPPVLGTGGNVGRLDFSNNFMQRLVDALVLRDGRGAPTRDDAVDWARAAVAGVAARKLMDKPIGQFDPGAAGGTNAPPGGPERSLVNPWDFILTFEGSLLFASGAARRMGAESEGKAAMPFTFDGTPVGYPSAAEAEGAKGELWAPLWSRPTSLAELRRLLGEGRVEWRGARARRGIDAARAAASLGVDRGITDFARFAFVERMGQAMLAVPIGRVVAATSHRRDVPVLGDLDRWVEQVRRAKILPAGPATALRRLDRAMFDLAGPESEHSSVTASGRLQEVLAVAAELERAVARSGSLRKDVVGEPLGNPTRRLTAADGDRPLDAARWLPLLDDGTSEFRLAASFASGRDRASSAAAASEGDERVLIGIGFGNGDGPATPAGLLRSVSRLGRQWWAWNPDGKPVVPGLGVDDLVEVLGALVQRRAIDVGSRGDSGARAAEPPRTGADGGDGQGAGDNHGSRRPAALVHGPAGIDPGFTDGIEVPLADVGRFLAGEVDDTRLERLTAAMLLLHYRERLDLTGPDEDASDVVVAPAAALILPFFHGRPFRPVGAHRVRLQAGRTWARLLAAGRVVDVVEDALHRLRVARLTPLVGRAAVLSGGVDGPRLLAATAFRLSTPDVRALVSRVAKADRDIQPSASTLEEAP